MRRFWRENSLTIVLFLMFVAFVIGQVLTGFNEFNNEQIEHGEAEATLSEYLGSPHFGEAIFENWESEFLQMSVYVLFTIFLRQKGSSESKKLEGEEPVDEDPRKHSHDPNAPWAVRTGGVILKVYESSLSLALLALFLGSFVLHAVTGAGNFNEEQIAHGLKPVSVTAYVTTARFWFESFQNWQSEFLAVGSIVLLSVFLRQRGSPESKPVAAPHFETASEG